MKEKKRESGLALMFVDMLSERLIGGARRNAGEVDRLGAV